MKVGYKFHRHVFLMVLPILLFIPAELGDFDPEVHTPGYISEFHFVPSQTEALELATYKKFQECR